MPESSGIMGLIEEDSFKGGELLHEHSSAEAILLATQFSFSLGVVLFSFSLSVVSLVEGTFSIDDLNMDKTLLSDASSDTVASASEIISITQARGCLFVTGCIDPLLNALYGRNAATGIANGFQGYIPVAAKPEQIFGGIIASSKAHLNKPGHVTFDTTFS